MPRDLNYLIGARRAMLSLCAMDDDEFERRLLRPHLEAIAYHQQAIERHERDREQCRQRVEALTEEIHNYKQQQLEDRAQAIVKRKQTRERKQVSNLSKKILEERRAIEQETGMSMSELAEALQALREDSVDGVDNSVEVGQELATADE